MINERRTVGGLRFGRETPKYSGEIRFCHFIHHKSNLTWDRTWAAAVDSRLLHYCYRSSINHTDYSFSVEKTQNDTSLLETTSSQIISPKTAAEKG
jgi:hypothetical protein